MSPGEFHEHIYIYIWPNPFLHKKKPKMVFFPEKLMELDSQTQLSLKSVLPGECHKNINVTTPLFFKKKPKMVLLLGKRTDLQV